jgi:hypothetical protein
MLSSLLACTGNKTCDCIVLEKEIDSLNKQIISLQSEIEGYKNSPDKLLAQATDLYKQKGNSSYIAEILYSAKKYHPESAELKKIEDILRKREKEEEEAKAKEEAARLGAVNKLKKKHDDISGITWYSQPYYVHNENTNLFSTYIGKRGNSVWLRLKMSYCGYDWIFFENAYLSYDDGYSLSIDFNKYENKDTEVGSGGLVWEWIDVAVSDNLLFYLRGLADGKEPKMRLSGKYTKTRNLSKNEIKGLKDILMAYDVLRNN